MTDDTPVSWIAALKPLPERLEQELPGRWSGFDFLPRVDSTNRYLLESEDVAHLGYRVCVAREQTAGRGRRGRSWVSRAGSGLTFSLARTLALGETPAPALSLAIGVGLGRGLARCGLRGFGFKWPNDLVTENGAKLAGILVEARPGSEERRAALVAGVGLNCEGAAALVPDRAVADLADLGRTHPGVVRCLPDLLHAILAEIVLAWESFSRDGLAPMLDDYQRLDHLFGKRVRVAESGQEGIAAGVDPADGALLLQRPTGVQRLYSGDVSIRRVDGG